MTTATTVRPMNDRDELSSVPQDLSALRARNPDAVAGFVRDHEAAVRRFVARIMAWSDDVPDLVQDVFATAIVALPRFRGESSIETWLTRIAINRCRRHIRRRRLFGRFLAGKARPASDTPADVLDRSETDVAVRNAVAALPARYREVIVLRYLEERSTQQTADILNERPNTIDVRLHRARRLLETSLHHLVKP